MNPRSQIVNKNKFSIVFHYRVNSLRDFFVSFEDSDPNTQTSRGRKSRESNGSRQYANLIGENSCVILAEVKGANFQFAFCSH